MLRALLCACVLTATAFGGETPIETELFTLIRRQAAALEKEELEAVLATIHPESPLRESTKALLEKTKDTYELKYTLSELALESSGEEEASVTFTQKTEKLSGIPPFRDNRIHGRHVFRKFEGRWLFYVSEVLERSYLDKAATLLP